MLDVSTLCCFLEHVFSPTNTERLVVRIRFFSLARRNLHGTRSHTQMHTLAIHFYRNEWFYGIDRVAGLG